MTLDDLEVQSSAPLIQYRLRFSASEVAARLFILYLRCSKMFLLTD